MSSTLVSYAETRQAEFGKMPDGGPVSVYTMSNKNRVKITVMTYGGIVTSIETPDRRGAASQIVLGFDSLPEYLAHPQPYFGALIGRYANRIGGARFKLEGTDYKLDANDGANSLHGGAHGFDKVNWTGRQLPDGGVEMSYTSKDGEGGYPGTVHVTATYHLTDANELRIDYSASTNKTTVVNLTNHSYFNLRGDGDILGHMVTINADRFTPVDAGLIPTGELRLVDKTPFDFRKATPIGARIEQNDEQLKLGKGYDHNWVVNGTGLRVAARVEEPTTGRVLEVLTTQPGIQFYTGNFLDGTIRGHGGKIYARRSGLCLETQHFPDSPNKPSFPSAVLKPGDTFRSSTVYKFSTK
jgi:aldose 1-epimerase